MSSNQSAIQNYLSSLVGEKLTLIEQHEFSWSFAFASAATLTVVGPWRVRSVDAIVVSSLDQGEKFGLSAPIDLLARAQQLIGGKSVREISARDGQGDLTICLDDEAVLESLNLSIGYEAWQISKPQGATLISMGGGKLVFY